MKSQRPRKGGGRSDRRKKTPIANQVRFLLGITYPERNGLAIGGEKSKEKERGALCAVDGAERIRKRRDGRAAKIFGEEEREEIERPRKKTVCLDRAPGNAQESRRETTQQTERKPGVAPVRASGGVERFLHVSE